MSALKKKTHKQRLHGIEILYEDRDIIVVEKQCGLLTMGTNLDKSRTVHAILNDYVRKGDPRSRNRAYIVHRLDRETSGILLFARSEAVKLILQNGWKDTQKMYLAVVHGILPEKQGTISSYLTENSAMRVFSTNNAALGKLSHTEYTVIQEAKGLSLLSIKLLTGRKHQIRVHLSEKGYSVVGDTKYGKGKNSGGNLALHAGSISFKHPISGKQLEFTTRFPDRFTSLIGIMDTLHSDGG